MADKKIASVCPCCGSTDTRLVESSFDSGTYTDHMACDECDAEWREEFVYTSFEIVKKEAGSGDPGKSS